MSTRGLIMRYTPEGGLFGRYHHFDSYPTGLGKTLWRTLHGHFGGDLAAMLKVLIDDHPAGWSSINDCNWNLEPGYGLGPKNYYGDRKYRTPDGKTDFAKIYADTPPACYCHGERSEERQDITEKGFKDSWAEYVYAFNVGDRRLDIFTPAGYPAPFAEIDLDGPEPEWEEVSAWEEKRGFYRNSPPRPDPLDVIRAQIDERHDALNRFVALEDLLDLSDSAMGRVLADRDHRTAIKVLNEVLVTCGEPTHREIT